MIARLIKLTRRYRGLDFALFACLIVALLAIIRLLPEPEMRQVIGNVRVVDGDSIELAGERVRLRGIDAPELAQSCQRGGRDWACGRQARDRLRRMIGSETVTCKAARRDKHNRLLGICKAGEREINEWMVTNGWAVSYDEYGAAERAAQKARRGLWSGTFERPRDWREAHGRR